MVSRNLKRDGLAILLIAGATLAPALPAFAGAPSSVAQEDNLLVTEAPVTGFVNDGDQSVVETLFVYLDGCPLLSLTPPASGRGAPLVTMIEQTGECAPSSGLADKQDLPMPAHMLDDGGMHVQLWRDDPSDLQTIAADPDLPDEGRSLIIEVSSLYPPESGADEDDDGPIWAFGGAPQFWIPGVFGDPSGDLVQVMASGSPEDRARLFGNGPMALSGFPRGGGGSGSGEGEPGQQGSGPHAPTFLVSKPNLSGVPGAGPSAGSGLNVAPVPLPATLLLLLWAFQMMRGFVRRR